MAALTFEEDWGAQGGCKGLSPSFPTPVLPQPYQLPARFRHTPSPAARLSSPPHHTRLLPFSTFPSHSFHRISARLMSTFLPLPPLPPFQTNFCRLPTSSLLQFVKSLMATGPGVFFARITLHPQLLTFLPLPITPPFCRHTFSLLQFVKSLMATGPDVFFARIGRNMVATSAGREAAAQLWGFDMH